MTGRARATLFAGVVALIGAGWSAASAADELSVAEALGVARAINAGEVDQARAVQARLDDEDAAAFARVMIREHAATLDQLSRVARELGVEPAGSELKSELEARSRRLIGRLREADDDEVSGEYIASQVQMHREALELIDDELMPAAQDEPRLRDAFVEMRALVAAHLRRAEQLDQD